MRYGLIGEHLGHSYSREIHEHIADYSYELLELAPEQVESFLFKREFDAINVTIPYKKTVIPFLDEIDSHAKEIGAVNTVVNRNGRLYGYNTDFFGVRSQLEHMHAGIYGKKVLILGTGGTAQTVHAVAEHLHAQSIIYVSHSGKSGAVTYDEALTEHNDAQFIFNTTPVGMYPQSDAIPIDISHFSHLEGVFDAVYNPLRTDLVLAGEKRNIPSCGGLYMLASQAVYASQLFTDGTVTAELTDKAYSAVKAQKSNTVLIGMPSCGKSTVGKLLASMTGKPFFDTDELIEQDIGMKISEFFAKNGEKDFREKESAVIAELSQTGGKVIATGGGAILDKDNVRRLKHNGTVVFIDRALENLIATSDRPLSRDKASLEKLYSERYGKYTDAADIRVISQQTPQKTTKAVLKALQRS